MSKAGKAGKVKTWQNRMSTYTQLVSLFMVFYIFIQDNRWLEWYQWIIVFIVIISSILYVDIKYVFGEQQDYAFDKSKRFKELRKTVLDNNKKLKILLEEK